jgi:hypothetical protein
MTQSRVLVAILVGVLLIAGAFGYSCAIQGKATVSSLWVDGYGQVINSEGEWLGEPPEGLEGPAGAQGEQGPQGPQGEQGLPGPNMIVAMGTVGHDGTIYQDYNIESVLWNDTIQRYEITLTFAYDNTEYVTVVTPQVFLNATGCASGSTPGDKLGVYIYNSAGTKIQTPFSFVVLQVP